MIPGVLLPPPPAYANGGRHAIAYEDLTDHDLHVLGARQEVQVNFSDGLADELLNVLGKIRGLRVAARSSAFTCKGKGTTGLWSETYDRTLSPSS